MPILQRMENLGRLVVFDIELVHANALKLRVEWKSRAGTRIGQYE